MAIRIREDNGNSIFIQGGSGVPTHLSPRGSLYIDKDAGVAYINKNNLAYWAELSDSASGSTLTGAYLPLSGGTVTGPTNFTNGLSADTISATTYLNLPIDVRVTGGTFNVGTGIATFTNNTGGTFNVSGFITSGGTIVDKYVTGFTYNGSNILTIKQNENLSNLSVVINTMSGLTINGSLSATTYLNLPIDIQTTGATYSNNTFLFTNNTGGTYSVLFNTVTGLTINGNLNVTGNTIFTTGLSANTISATTYYNLPNYVSGTGTTGYISKFISGSSIGNSVIYETTGGTVGIGTTTPSRKLDVNGDANISQLLVVGTDIYSSRVITNAIIPNTLTYVPFYSNASPYGEIMRMQNDGNVLIGTNTSNGNKLQVSGNTNISGGLTATTISATTYYNLPNYFNGSGTTNYIPKWTSSSGLGNSLIYDDGTNIMIGNTITNGNKLQVRGTTSLISLTTSGTSLILGNTSFNFNFNTSIVPQILSLAYGTNNILNIGYDAPNDLIRIYNGGNIQFSTNYFSVGGDANNPISSARVNIESTTKGVLFPRMTTVQRNAILSASTGLMVYDTDVLSLYQYNGSSWLPIRESITGTGTTGYIPKFISGSSIGNSVIYETAGGTVGIGTTTPAYKLDVSGTGRYNDTLSVITTYNPQILAYTTVGGGGKIIQGYNGGYTFSIDGANGGGPRLGLSSSDSNVYDFFELGAFANANNFATKTRNFRILSTISSVEDVRFQIFANSGNVVIQDGGTFTDNGNKLQVSGNTNIIGGLTANTISATTYYNLPNYVGGTGTTGYIPKFISGSSIGNSLIYETTGGTVNIGTTTPTGHKLNVQGSSRFLSTLNIDNTSAGQQALMYFGYSYGLRLKMGYVTSLTPVLENNVQFGQIISDDSGNINIASRSDNPSGLRFYTTLNTTSGYSEAMRITNAGDLLIGTVSESNTKLVVNGNLKALAGFSEIYKLVINQELYTPNIILYPDFSFIYPGGGTVMKMYGDTHNVWIGENPYNTTEKFTVQGTSSLRGNVYFPTEDSSYYFGNDSAFGIVKKTGTNGFLGVSNGGTFYIKRSSTSNIDASTSNTFTTIFSINPNNLLTHSASATFGASDNTFLKLNDEIGFIKKVGGGPILAVNNYRDIIFAQSNSGFITSADTYNTFLTIKSSTGNVGIGTPTPTTKLEVNGDTKISGGLTASTISATTYYNLPNTTFTGGTVTGPTRFTNGLTATTISATTYYNLPNYFGGTGTTGYIPKFISGSSIGDSRIYDNGTNVIIGGASPILADDALSVYGNTRVQNFVAENSLYSRTNFFMLGGSAQLGTGTNTGERLQVFGDARIGGISYAGSSIIIYGQDDVLLPIEAGLKISYNNSSNVGTIQSGKKAVSGYTLSLGGNPLIFFNSNSGVDSGRFSESGNLLIGTKIDNGNKLQVSGNTKISGGLTANTISANSVNIGVIITNYPDTTLYSKNTGSTTSNLSFFTDNFNRALVTPGGVPSVIYTTVGISQIGPTGLNTNALGLTQASTYNILYSRYPAFPVNNYNTQLNSNSTILQWAVNVRQSLNGSVSGFGTGQVGQAVVLACNNPNPSSSGSNGYALVFGNLSTNQWSLVYFTNGLNNNGNITNLISSTNLGGDNRCYYSLRVTYNPSTNVWTLYNRVDGCVSSTTLWGDPLTVATLVGSATSNTYTSIPLPYFAFVYNASTGNGYFDNFSLLNLNSITFSDSVRVEDGNFNQINAHTILQNLTSLNASNDAAAALLNVPLYGLYRNGNNIKVRVGNFTDDVYFTGGTVSGATVFTAGLTATTISASTISTPSFKANSNGLTATTISATTYLNLPNYVGGTGTTGYIPKFISGSSLGNSVIYETTGGTVGIGTTTPSQKLGVNGSIIASAYIIAGNDVFASGLRGNYISPNTLTYIPFISSQSPYGEIMRVQNNGNVLIGTISDNLYKLDVNGATRIKQLLTVEFPSIVDNTSLFNIKSGVDGTNNIFDVQYYKDAALLKIGYAGNNFNRIELNGGADNIAPTINLYESGITNTSISASKFNYSYFNGTLLIGTNTYNYNGDKLQVSGNTNIRGGLTASTISATTYLNLPSSTFSGGTINGATNFTNGLTANTISKSGGTSLQYLMADGSTSVIPNSTSGYNSNVNPVTYALQDAPILYHSLAWFTPAGTISTTGISVSTTIGQFASTMIGAKLTINGEWRIITAYTNTTNVSVASSYSQNYSGIAGANFGVYNKYFANVDTNKTNVVYDYQNNIKTYFDVNGNFVSNSLYNIFQNINATAFFAFGTNAGMRFSPQNNDSLTDVRLKRLTSGILQIDDGTTDTNYRDLILRNLTGTTLTTTGLTASTISATTYLNLPSSIFTGGTVTGPTRFTNGLTANTISATTYLNVPSSTFSGGTVTGPTNFTNGLTANTISIVPKFVSQATYTATTSDYIILGDVTVVANIYLPPASSCTNKIYEFGWYNYQNEVFSGEYYIVPSAGDTFDTPQSISSLPCLFDNNFRMTTKIISNGVKWHILQSNTLGMTLP